MPVVALFALLGASPFIPSEVEGAPELGKVPWLRDFEAAVRLSRETKKPLLVLFDEVPGCDTVLGFGREVLSAPEIVAAITRDFVPVALFNNAGGADAKVLQSFGEPSWNNPVVRIIDADRKPLAPRFEGPYSLEAFQKLLAFSPSPRGGEGRGEGIPSLKKFEQVTLSAACFWECEARLGKLDAVRASRVGFLQGEEVAEVSFDSSVMNRAQFLTEAAKLECANRVFTAKEAEAIRYSEKDTKYFLRASRRSMDGLSEQEKVRLNSAR